MENTFVSNELHNDTFEEISIEVLDLSDSVGLPDMAASSGTTACCSCCIVCCCCCGSAE